MARGARSYWSVTVTSFDPNTNRPRTSVHGHWSKVELAVAYSRNLRDKGYQAHTVLIRPATITAVKELHS